MRSCSGDVTARSELDVSLRDAFSGFNGATADPLLRCDRQAGAVSFGRRHETRLREEFFFS